MEERETNAVTPDANGEEVARMDAAYQPFPSFSEWTGEMSRPEPWDKALEALAELRKGASEAQLTEAIRFVMRAAAIDTGAIEGLYEVDRGFTYTVAAQNAAWEAAMDERGTQIRPLFEAQLKAYELVLTAATENVPIVEAWLRRLHEEVCAAQETHRVLTDAGWQEQRLAKGEYKAKPNHVVRADGSTHSYAPVAETRPEMERLVAEFATPELTSAHPVVQAAYAHYGFVAIHPFSDGNGRVARALASVFLYRAASVPLLIFADRKLPYFDALLAADEGDHEAFTLFILQAALTAVTLATENLRTAATPEAAVSLTRMRQLLIVPGTLTHTEMDALGSRVQGEVVSAVTSRLRELEGNFPPGVTGAVTQGGATPPEIPEFQPLRGQPQSFFRAMLNSEAPAAGGVEERLWVQLSTGRDPLETLVVIRERIHEQLVFSLQDVHPDLSMAAQARLKALAERIWNELLEELYPVMQQSLLAGGYSSSD